MKKNVLTVAATVLLMVLSGAAGVADSLDRAITESLSQARVGDFADLAKSGMIRALVPYSKTFYYFDGQHPRGITYEALKEFEKAINRQLKTKHVKVHVVIVPTPRDRLLPALIEGLGDIAAGNLSVTSERMEEVDFADPFHVGVDEILVTGPGSPPIATIDDLAGQEVYVRKSSSYWQSLLRLNARFAMAGKEPVIPVPVSEYLEDEDLMEMVNAGLMPMIIVDDHKAGLWAHLFTELRVHKEVQLDTGGRIAWAIRKNSPELKKLINAFVASSKKGTLLGNVLINKYFAPEFAINNNLTPGEQNQFKEAAVYFEKYGKQYGLDWRLLAALSYQESHIDQSKRSAAGAIGVMQVLPATAKDRNVNIADIENLESNIHAGTKYIRFIIDTYFADAAVDDLNRGLLAFASYNAGPAKISRLRKAAEEQGLDPNIWFRNVEMVAAQNIGRETVQYVSNIFKYYTAYTLADRYSGRRDVIKDAYAR